MIKYQENLSVTVGAVLQPMLGAEVRVIDKATGLPASLYQDDELTPISQPLITDNTGYFAFKAADGKYTLSFSSSRFATFTREIVLEDPADNPFASLQELALPNGAGKIGNKLGAEGAVLRNVKDKQDEVISLLDFMSEEQKADVLAQTAIIPVADAVEKAIRHGLSTGKKIVGPVGAFRLERPVPITNEMVANWPFLDFEGESSGSAVSIHQSGNVGTVFVTDGNNAFDIDYDAFNNESVKMRGFSIRNDGVKGASVGIRIIKDSPHYPRKLFLDDINVIGFDSAFHLIGKMPAITDNFFGTTVFGRIHTYDCNRGLRFTDCYMNLAKVDDSLFHECAMGGMVFDADASGVNLMAGGVFSISYSHFEGCEPAGLVMGNRSSEVNLHNVSTENCGITSGDGAWKLGGYVKLSITGNANVPGTFEVPPMLPPYCKLYSTVPVTVRSKGGFVGTPESVTLHAGADDHSFAYFPLEKIGVPYRAAAQFPYTTAAGGTGIPANLASKYSFTADAKVYDQGAASNTITAGTSAAYVVASFISKASDYEGFAIGSQYKLAGYGPFNIATANCSELKTPLACTLVIHVPAFTDVNSLVLNTKAAGYSTNAYVSREESLRPMLSLAHPEG